MPPEIKEGSQGQQATEPMIAMIAGVIIVALVITSVVWLPLVLVGYATNWITGGKLFDVGTQAD